MRLRAILAGGLLAVCLACGGPTSGPAAPQAAPPTAAAPQATTTPATGASASPAAGVAASPAASPVAAPSLAAAPSPAAAAQPDWLTYQHDPARSGQAPGTYAAATAKLLWETSPLDGQVYAQPLVAGNRVLVTTQNNTVYALDAASGRVVWSQNLGSPVGRNSLPCGNIDPTGILSTPVIDPVAGRLYAVDFLGQPPRHELVALDLDSGEVRFHQPVDPPGANPVTHQQRGALGFANGTVYVPFGGLFGDCGDYHGWVVGASASDGSTRSIYQVPSSRMSAIWSAPTLSPAGDVYVTTGNGASTTDFDQGNAVLRLSPDLKLLDFFAPSIWADLSRRDADLGSTGPIMLDNGLLLQVGKGGVGYLIQADRLGRIGGDVFQTSICNAGAYGGSGRAGSMVYIACRDGLAAVRVQGRAFSVVWHGPQFNSGAPTITEGAIWTIDDGTTSLYALHPQTGDVLFRAAAGQASNPPHFLTPAAAGGRVFHSRGRTIVAYGGG